ncbi:hypothetical protein [Robiginitalea biformata]|uniref:Uncharacterized protein n=1 Tax=Robiginitalea biformata (strain ATCC BAA-864 / DSM 15991 / KCTC 12146 / HTCC2501) TaxID=313596 RepID=A4CPW7_ROBBH|nr:hypothetical protein [Robiginitalea biformata]EAR14052.1 hypothetical protein RB2501_01460 [Robiginitalea biformata HTCC2501]
MKLIANNFRGQTDWRIRTEEKDKFIYAYFEVCLPSGEWIKADFTVAVIWEDEGVCEAMKRLIADAEARWGVLLTKSPGKLLAI